MQKQAIPISYSLPFHMTANVNNCIFDQVIPIKYRNLDGAVGLSLIPAIFTIRRLVLQNRHTHYHRSVWETWTTEKIFTRKSIRACCVMQWCKLALFFMPIKSRKELIVILGKRIKTFDGRYKAK